MRCCSFNVSAAAGAVFIRQSERMDSVSGIPHDSSRIVQYWTDRFSLVLYAFMFSAKMTQNSTGGFGWQPLHRFL